MAELTLAEVDTLINSLLTTQQVDYRVGSKSRKSGDKIRQLMEYRKHLLSNPTAEMSFTNIPSGFNEFGLPLAELQD